MAKDELVNSLYKTLPFFNDTQEALLYLTLLETGALGTEKLHQKTGLHRETIQRLLTKMKTKGTITLTQKGRNKKAEAVPIEELQQKIEGIKTNFDLLLKPLLEVTADKKSPKIQIYTGNHSFSLLQMRLLNIQPQEEEIKVISAHPKEWVEAMIESRKLNQFEDLRLKKGAPFLLSCFSELRGQVEHNNATYFSGQPSKLKRQYRYVESEGSSPIQIQIWFNSTLLSIFEPSSNLHILIEDNRIKKAMDSYFQILWKLGSK